MARKEITVIIDKPGRDLGKNFVLKEMSAMAAEKWAARALIALSRGGVDVPEDIAAAGLAGLAAFGLHAIAGVKFADAEPLMDEMMHCITIIPDPTRPMVRRALIEDDIEELSTLMRLRSEVVELHTNFSMAAALSKRKAQEAAAESISNIQTAPGQLVQ